MLTSLPYSMLYLSLLSTLAVVLTIRVVKIRMKSSIALGSGDDEILARQMRVQANFLENFLPFAILFLLVEMSDASNIILHIAGIAFLIARILHAYGFSQTSGRSFGRYYGTVLTWLSIIFLIVVNLYHAFSILV